VSVLIYRLMATIGDIFQLSIVLLCTNIMFLDIIHRPVFI
jgi:hypothetical protein